MKLDNRLVAAYFPPAYYLGMAGNAFRDRVAQAMQARGLSKAELSRLSGVPYHALDKFLKRDSASTSTDNAIALARVLGIKVDAQAEYEELRELFYRLDEQQRAFLVASVRGLLASGRE